MSQTKVRIIVTALLSSALLLIVLATFYQSDDTQNPTRTLDNADAVDNPLGTNPTNPENTETDLIKSFFPAGGTGGACQEAVGVQLELGYGANLTINDKEVPEEKMNLIVDELGNPTGAVSAARSTGKYTFRPESGCPNDTYLRPIDNVLQACVYDLTDQEKKCIITETYNFDAA